MQSHPRQLDALTGLRAVAALWVVAYHYALGPFRPLGIANEARFVHIGYLGVDLFFILSGFVIWHVHGHDFVVPRARVFGRFMCLRAARLYPVHVFTIALLGVLVWVGPGVLPTTFDPAHYTWRLLLLNLALLQSWGMTSRLGWNFPAWSVSAEWFCYLLFPLLALAAARTGRRGTIVGIILLMASSGWLGLTVFGGSLNQSTGAVSLLRAGPEFLLGCLLRRVAGQPGLDGWPWAGIVATTLGLWPLSVAVGAPAGLLAVPCFAALILAASLPGRPVAVALASPPLVAVGSASYALYLMQFPIEKIASPLTAHLSLTAPFSSGAEVVACLGILGATTWLVHCWVENPSRRWLRQRIDACLPRTPAAGGAPPVRRAHAGAAIATAWAANSGTRNASDS
jgi:peptidoglycan/LPS O-acetylase OafA/YrhL